MLTDLETIVLAKALKETLIRQAREKIEPKTYNNVDLTFNVKGDMTVNPDETYIPTIAVPLKPALALFIRYSGITRDSAIAALIRAMSDSLNNDEDSSATVLSAISDESEVIDDCERRVTAAMNSLPLKTRKGKILTNLAVTTL